MSEGLAGLPKAGNVKPAPRGLSARGVLDLIQHTADGFGALFDEFSNLPWIVIPAFTLIYLAATLKIASAKLLWDDEFFTLYISRDVHGILGALATGADQHPPSFYYLTHLITNILGTNHITFRLPAVVGYWLMCVCLYFIVGRLLSRAWGAVAMLIPLASPLYYYASEGRGYGLMVGLSALAWLIWLRACEGGNRKVLLPALAMCLAGAVSSHYYAILILLPLGLGELTRWALLKKVDFPMALAFCAPAVPLLLFLPIIRKASGYSKHFWARPHWSSLYYFYPSNLGPLQDIAIVAVIVALCYRVFFGHSAGAADPARKQRPWELASVIGLVAIPLAAMAIAKLVTNGFSDRYALTGLIGVAVVLCYLMFYISRGVTVIALIVWTGCLLSFGFNGNVLLSKGRTVRSDVAGEIHLLESTGKTPIAVAEVTVFHRLSFYAPRELVSRLTYVADPKESIKYLGHDTVDRGLLALRPWFPIHVVPLSIYLARTPKFLVYGYVGEWTWLTYDLSRPGLHTTLVGRRKDRILLSVQNDNANEIPAPPDQGESGSLFAKLPPTGEPICDMYMESIHCPAFR
ncbi:MAG TPA: glycosyltransferase family 39 protein [Bryobacteraceae bacterium]|nr:glycosyltransferase family 39 protein [Bryobacteraceae bacterium]